jgi:hypothetical protein
MLVLITPPDGRYWIFGEASVLIGALPPLLDELYEEFTFAPKRLLRLVSTLLILHKYNHSISEM